MTGVAALLLTAAVVAAGSAAPATRLSISLYPEGRGGTVQHFTLRCGPARGTVLDPARACAALARLARPFAPVPKGTVCTQIALGPQEAIVTGVVRGRRVSAYLRLRNGCEIDRWRRVRSIVPGFPASP